MTAETTVRAYYDALRGGEPLPPFFHPEDSLVKFGIGERLTGYDEIEAGLRNQTDTTRDWTVESHDLRVTETEDVAWFADEVRMAWRDDTGTDHDHETRWSGTLVPDEGEWHFVGMHVSTSDDP